MKKGKGKWLPLALMLAVGTALLVVGCDNGDDPVKTDPIPDKTQVTFQGRPIWFGTEYQGDNTSNDERDHYHLLQIQWKNEFQNKIDEISITLGRDYLEDGMKFLIMALVGPNPESYSIISQADCDALKAKIKAGLPTDSGKVIVDDNFVNVTKVDQYTSLYATQVTFDGKPIKVVPAADNIHGDYDTGVYKGKWHRVTIRWEDTFQNQIDKFSITWGKDYLEGEADTLNLFLEGKEDENATISKTDYTALLAKFQAALPADSRKNMRAENETSHHKVTVVEQYAAMVKDTVIRLAQSVRANFARGA
jgi:hypothetical protein